MENYTYFFCGIGGVGMNGLAQIVLAQGHTVAGSDRGYDMGLEPEKYRTLTQLGVTLYPQDGSGVTQTRPDFFVVSTAVEETIPDVKAAKEAGVRIIHRSDLLTELTQHHTLMTVGGTSGKSTTSAMLAHIMVETGFSPTVMSGAAVVGQPNKGVSNARLGTGDVAVIEVDESDRSIAKAVPDIAVLNNISMDHKSMDELRQMFGDYLGAARKGVVVNLDCPESMGLASEFEKTLREQTLGKKAVTFSLNPPEENAPENAFGKKGADFYATNIDPQADGISFYLNGEIPVKLAVFGRFNVANALAAIAAASLAGVTTVAAAKALESFCGTKRRLEHLGTQNGVTVIDDFAHNPHKIAATLKAFKEYPGRLFVVYQPHGFAPTKMFFNELVDVFKTHLAPDDHLYMPDIYFVGGTADKTISSSDLTTEIAASGLHANYVPNRADIPALILPLLRGGDRICIMGARDNTLPVFAASLLQDLRAMNAAIA